MGYSSTVKLDATEEVETKCVSVKLINPLGCEFLQSKPQ